MLLNDICKYFADPTDIVHVLIRLSRWAKITFYESLICIMQNDNIVKVYLQSGMN